MPGFVETLDLVLHADASGAISEIRRFADENEKTIKTASSAWSSFGSTAMKLGGTGLAVGGFLTAMGDKDRQAMESLKSAIATTGHAYDDYAGRVEAAIKVQAQFGNTDGEVTRSLSTLTLSYGDADKALDRMQLTADLAAMKHISLASAAEIVAKAHGGAGRIFKEFGIVVTDNADGTKNYERALDDLTGKLSGQASASVSGFTGWLKVQAAQLENLVSGFGEQYGPAISALAGGVTILGGAFSGVGKALDWLKAKRAADIALTEAEVVANEELAAAAGMSSLAMLGVAGGIALLGVAMYEGITNSSNLSYSLDGLVRGATQLKGTDLDKFVAGNTIVFDAAGKSLRDLGAEMAGHSIPAANAYADSLDRNGHSSAEFRQGIADNVTKLQDQKAASEASQAATEGLTVEQKKAADAIKAERDAYVALTASRQKDLDLVNSQISGEVNLSNAEIATRKAIDDMKKSLDDGKQSVDEHTKSINDAESAIIAETLARGEMARKQAEAAGITDTATAANEAEIYQLQLLATTLSPDSPLRQWLQEYIAELQSLPGHINTVISVSGPGGGPPQVKVGSGQTQSFDRGGPVMGPRGMAQLAIVHGGEHVLTAEQADAARNHSAAGGGNYTVNVYAMDQRGVKEVVIDALTELERRDGRLPLRSTAA